jgi:hypothetical protein
MSVTSGGASRRNEVGRTGSLACGRSTAWAQCHYGRAVSGRSAQPRGRGRLERHGRAGWSSGRRRGARRRTASHGGAVEPSRASTMRRWDGSCWSAACPNASRPRDGWASVHWALLARRPSSMDALCFANFLNSRSPSLSSSLGVGALDLHCRWRWGS